MSKVIFKHGDYATIKRYFLFAGEEHHPRGGFHDIVASSSNLSELVSLAESICQRIDYDWWHIYDAREDKIIAEAEK